MQVTVPHKSGNVYVYDSPHSVALDYDLPPAHYTHGRDSRSTLSRSSLTGQLDIQTDYDVPPTADAGGGRPGIHSAMFGAVYDSPPSLLQYSQTYDVPTSVGADVEHISLSNRSSVLSNDSRSSIASLRSGSSPSTSARSSAEVSFRDIYDTPRASDISRTTTVVEAAGRLSSSKLLSGMTAADRDSYLEDYSVPRNSAASSVASDSNSLISDRAAKGLSVAALKMTSLNEEQDFYDVPRNQLTDEGCDYDVPSKSHSSSQTSLTKHMPAPSSVSRPVSESVSQSDVFHRQIVAKHDAILRSIERLTELAKKEVRGNAKHWCSLVTTTGLSLRTALKELLDLGRVAESHGDSVVASQLSQQCVPLFAVYTGISQCLETLLAMSPFKASEARCFSAEDLTNLTELVDRLHPLANEFCVFLHSNAVDICRLSLDHKPPEATASPVIGRRQAPAVKPKANISQRTPPTDVQQRPLPVPPSLEKANAQPAVGKQNSSLTYDDYDYISISREVESSTVQQEQAVSDQPAFENLQRSASTHPPPSDPSKRCAVINGVVDQRMVLSASDSDMIAYYAARVRTQTSAVESAVSEFCRQSTTDVVPEVFVELSKQVVVAGHKLVYIGDTVARHITDNNVCNHVASAANELCDCLKSVVISTKEAVLTVPSSDTFHTQAVDSAKSALAACKQLCDVIESYAGHS